MNYPSIIYSNLRAEIARENISIKKLASEVGVNRDTMSRKLLGKIYIKRLRFYLSQQINF